MVLWLPERPTVTVLSVVVPDLSVNVTIGLFNFITFADTVIVLPSALSDVVGAENASLGLNAPSNPVDARGLTLVKVNVTVGLGLSEETFTLTLLGSASLIAAELPSPLTLVNVTVFPTITLNCFRVVFIPVGRLVIISRVISASPVPFTVKLASLFFWSAVFSARTLSLEELQL